MTPDEVYQQMKQRLGRVSTLPNGDMGLNRNETASFMAEAYQAGRADALHDFATTMQPQPVRLNTRCLKCRRKIKIDDLVYAAPQGLTCQRCTHENEMMVCTCAHGAIDSECPVQEHRDNAIAQQPPTGACTWCLTKGLALADMVAAPAGGLWCVTCANDCKCTNFQIETENFAKHCPVHACLCGPNLPCPSDPNCPVHKPMFIKAASGENNTGGPSKFVRGES